MDDNTRIGKRSPCSVAKGSVPRTRRPCLTSDPTLTTTRRRESMRSLPNVENFSNMTCAPADLEICGLNLLQFALNCASRDNSSQRQSFKSKMERSNRTASEESTPVARMRRLSMTDCPLKRTRPSSFSLKSCSTYDADCAISPWSDSCVDAESFDNMDSFPINISISAEALDRAEVEQRKLKFHDQRRWKDRRKVQRVLTRSISLDEEHIPHFHSRIEGLYTMAL